MKENQKFSTYCEVLKDLIKQIIQIFKWYNLDIISKCKCKCKSNVLVKNVFILYIIYLIEIYLQKIQISKELNFYFFEISLLHADIFHVKNLLYKNLFLTFSLNCTFDMLIVLLTLNVCRIGKNKSESLSEQCAKIPVSLSKAKLLNSKIFV